MMRRVNKLFSETIGVVHCGRVDKVGELLASTSMFSNATNDRNETNLT